MAVPACVSLHMQRALPHTQASPLAKTASDLPLVSEGSSLPQLNPHSWQLFPYSTSQAAVK